MAEDPSPPSPELTEELKQRIETNRLRALSLLAKRQASSMSNPQHPIDYWKSFKSRKVIDPSTNLPVPSKNEPVSPPLRFRVRLEICSPDSFSINPSLVQGFRFPGQDDCFQIIEACLSNVMSTHYTQIHGGGKASVYKLTYYDAVLKCLKNCTDIEEVEEIPWTTYNVMMKLSHSLMPGKWTPCRPEHLSDEKVEELIKKLPRKLLGTLLPFQLDGLKFGLQRGGRCLIADEMGLGKTLQAIAIASCFANEGLILVVCPAILRYAWAEELEHWLPSYLPADIHLVFGYKDNPVHLKRRPKVVVISYTMLKRLRDSILKWEWSVMIVDESHHIRCSKKKSEPGEIQAVLDVASEAKRIILLSGTPSLSRPGLLGKDKYEYANTYCSAKLINNHKGKTFMDISRGTRLEELNVLLRQTVMIRRLKEHLLVQLPPKRRQIISLSLKKVDILIAKNVVANLGESHANHAGKDGDNDTGGHDRELSDQVLGISKVLGFFEWLSLHPIVTEADDSNNTELDASSHKMIIFAHHLKVLDKLQAFLCNKGIGFVRIDGNILDCDRQNAVRSFQSSKEVKIAIIGITVGYAGLDLSVARNVVFLELPKDPTSLQQAEDRAHRRGQTNAVNIYIFCAKDTSDESRWRKLNRSIQRVSSVIDGKYDAIREFAVDNVSCIRNMNLFQSVNSSYAAPSIEKCPTEENVQQNGAEYDDDDDVKTDETVKVTQELTKENDCLTISQSFVQVNMDSLRFAVSQYTGRVHLCICDLAEDSAPRSLSENFRIEEISADPSEWTSVFIKENPTCQLAIVSFINEWKNLKHIEKKKLFGKPLQLPLAIELLRLSESNNHDRKGLLKGGSKRRHTPLFEISCPQSNALFKQVCLLDGRKKKTWHLQYWTLMDEPLCKFCQNPCQGIFAKKPKVFFDLFCSNVCYDKYRSMTSGRYLRQELFQIERGVCTNCELDCHKLVQHLLPLAVEDREKYIEREAPQLTKHRKLLDKLVREPTEGNAWHADHIIAVFMGGGECALENMRTLCVACHAAVTAAQHTQRCMENKLYRKALASFRRSNKKKTLRKNRSSAMKEKLDDDSELLIDVPGSNYSKESVEKKDIPGSNYSEESEEKKDIIPGSNYSEESEEKKDIIPGSNCSEESEEKKDDSSLKQPLIADFSKFSFTGTC